MTSRYVVADDGSDAAVAARRWAEQRAGQDGVSCVAVRIGDLAAGAARPRTDAAERPVVTLSGRVPDALAAFAAAEDVLVLGTGKTGFVHGRVSGFTGLQIVARATCAVAVVPDIDLRFRSGIVVGVDRAESAVVTACAAGREAARLGEAVRVIHGHERVEPPGESIAIRLAEDAIRTGWPALTIRTRIVSHSAAEALLDAARSASLLVIGRGRDDHASSGPRVLGRVVLEVLINANSPVLVTAP